MTILDNSFAKSSYHEDGNYILFEYKKFGTSVAFRDAWEQTGKIVIQNQVSKYVSDSRKMTVINQEDQKWLSEDWGTRMKKAVPKDTFTAIILDTAIFTEITAKSVVSIMEKGKEGDDLLKFEFFKDINAAINWIKNVEHQLEPLAR